MPLGLLSLAGNLLNKNENVKIYKPKVRLLHQQDYQLAATDILKNKPELIGFSTWCITYPASLLIAKEIKKINPEIPIIFGGPQASVLAKETLENFPFIDFILTGEADNSFPQFVKELSETEPDFSIIPGLSYRTGTGLIQQNKLNGSVSNLDELPVPAYNLVPAVNWLKLDVGRGCPFQCTYCSTSDFFSKKYRVKSPERIVNEMMQAFLNKKITSFSFAHDMFTLNKKFVFELCDRLIGIKKTKGIEFKWNCSARIDCVSEEMLIKMKDAGCSDIFFGIESGSGRIQKLIKKNLDVSTAYYIADICRSTGIRMHASFIIGFPEETRSDVNKTLMAALNLAIKGALTQVSELSLLPGTPIFIEHHKKLKFDGQFSNFSRNYCGNEEIKLIKKYPGIFSSFYYLPVKPISRKEMLFLRFIINKSKDFRNTLFLLSEFIEKDFEQIDILSLYKKEFNRITKEEKNQNPIAMHWIKAVDNYLIINKTRIRDVFIRNIFEYEAYSSLLQTLYSTWQLVQPNSKNLKLQNNFIIKPTPIWKTIITNYKLEHIIPSENGWIESPKGIRKGRFNYLLIAISENKCQRIRISTAEFFLLKNLTELSFLDFVEKVKLLLDKNDALIWLKKMRRRGVAEFSEITLNDS